MKIKTSLEEVMDIDKVNEKLKKYFSEQRESYENRRVVIWYDEEKDYIDSIEDLELNEVKIIKFDDTNNFEVKYQVEYKNKDKDYLIYAPCHRPSIEENWLLDIETYAYNFTVDSISILMDDFGVDKSLYNDFKRYKKFFDNKNRKKYLEKYNEIPKTEQELGILILSALTQLDSPNFENSIRSIFKEGLDEEKNKYYIKIKKYGDLDHFWRMIEEYFGYKSHKRSLEELLYFIVINYIGSNLKTDIPSNWSEQYLNSHNSIVFLNQWLNHKRDQKYFIELLPKIDETLSINKYLSEWEVKDFIECEYTDKIELIIIKKIKNKILDNYDNYEELLNWIEIRKKKVFYSLYKNVYKSLLWSINFLKLKQEIKEISIEKADYFLKKYAESYYQFDNFYRKYNYNYEKVKNKEILEGLIQKIEKIYTNWYLEELGLKWSQVVEDELENKWEIENINQQKDFFNTYVKKTLDQKERIYVIISDALRYEVGKDLKEVLNREIDGITKISYMQSSLPSNTKFGMATLLPHKKIELKNNKVVVDGIDSQGSNNRLKVLDKYAEGKATLLKGDEVLNISRNDLREKCKGKKLVYIYHNLIDATGDNASTENEVFSACKKTIDQIEAITRKLKHNISASNFVITSDHGFIYKRTKLKESDKTPKAMEKFETKRRYAFGKSDVDFQGIHELNLKYLGIDQDIFVPKGMNVFSKKGPGMNFVHGGVQLQEVVVPVISIKRKRNNEEYKSSKVDIELIGNTKRINNKIFNIKLFQSQKISERVLKRKLQIYFVDEYNEIISDIHEVVADKKGENRVMNLKFTLKNKSYSDNQKCYLILKDSEEKIEKQYKKIAYNISLLISDDFGF